MKCCIRAQFYNSKKSDEPGLGYGCASPKHVVHASLETYIRSPLFMGLLLFSPLLPVITCYLLLIALPFLVAFCFLLFAGCSSCSSRAFSSFASQSISSV